MSAISSTSHHAWQEYAAAAAQAATSNAGFMAALNAKSPKVADALEAFAKANGAQGAGSSNSGNGAGATPPVATPPVVIPPVVVALPVEIPTVATPPVTLPAPAVVAAVAQPLSVPVTARKPAVPPGQVANAATPSAPSSAAPTPSGNAFGLLKKQPVDAPPPADVPPATAPEPAPTDAAVASASTASVAPRNTSERVSLLYQSTQTLGKTSVPTTVAEIGHQMLSAVGETAIAPKESFQLQLGGVVQQLLDTRIDVRDDTRQTEPGRHERTARPYRTDVTA